MRSRGVAGAALLALEVLLVACSHGDGASGDRAGSPASSPTSANAPTSAVTPAPPPAGVTTSSAPAAAADRPGAVTLHVGGLVLPDTGAGGTGLRVLVRPASPGLSVRRSGGGGPVTACPITSVAGPVTASACVDLVGGRPVEMGTWGVELRATGADAGVDDAAVSYVPADHSVTLVTPARPAGVCSARPCEATFALTPSQGGTFSLDGRAGAGRPRLTLSSNTPGGGSIRTIATVEGGGNLSITATVDGAAQATLAYREGSSGAVPAMTAEILWP